MREAMKRRILELAGEAGYDEARVAPPRLEEEDRSNLLRFLEERRYGSMEWFAAHREIRLEPHRLMDGSRSVLVLATLYRNRESDALLEDSFWKVSRYAAGRDYHKLLRRRGKRLLASIAAEYPGVEGRIAVDSAPVPEKILGRMAGVGFQGKNTNLIHRDLGSYFFLSLLFLNAELPPDDPVAEGCGTCRLCLDACPTGALEEGRIDPRLCLSYLTIERGEPIPPERALESRGWIFGCDICQEVCPYNRRERARNRESSVEEFLPGEAFLTLLGDVWPGEEEWERRAAGTPFRRAGRELLLENRRRIGEALRGEEESAK